MRAVILDGIVLGNLCLGHIDWRALASKLFQQTTDSAGVCDVEVNGV